MRLQRRQLPGNTAAAQGASTARPRRVGRYECGFHNNYYANQISFRRKRGSTAIRPIRYKCASAEEVVKPIGAKSGSLCEMGRCPSRPLHSSRASGTKTFVLRYRPAGTGRDGPKRFLKIGRYDPLTPHEARRQAREILGQVASGKDPTADLAVGRATITVADLAARYLDGEVTPKRKAHTTALYVHYLNRFVRWGKSRQTPSPGRRYQSCILGWAGRNR